MEDDFSSKPPRIELRGLLGPEYGEPIDTMTRFGKLAKNWITTREPGTSCFIYSMGVYKLMEQIDKKPQIVVRLDDGISDHGWVEVDGYAIDLDPMAHVTNLLKNKNRDVQRELIERIRTDQVLVLSIYSTEYTALTSGQTIEKFDNSNTAKWEEHYMHTRDRLFTRALVPPDIIYGLRAVDKALR